MRKFLSSIVILLVVASVAAGGLGVFFRLEGTPPHVEVADPPEVIGREYILTARVSDARSGLRYVTVVLVQGEKIAVVGMESNPITEWWRGTGVREQDVSFVIRPLVLGLTEGEAQLQVRVSDASWRNVLKGNQGVWERQVLLDTTPPRIAVRSTVHNLAQGGSGFVVYRLNEPASRSGVLVNDLFFPGYPKPDGPEGLYVAMMAVPFDVKAPQQMLIEAVDVAGNVAHTGFPYQVSPRKPKVDRITISDPFLQQKMPDLMTRYPQLKGSLGEVFLQVNRDIRQLNNDQVRQACGSSAPTMLWSGPFLRLPHAANRAGFAEKRNYFYQGKEVDQAFHMGADLASVSHAPVPAGNTGQVVFADYLGIYGNTVILDHGLGLFSMYSHMSAIQVSPGDTVSLGQIIGTTGMTGLAGGDHLHFAMTIHGVFVSPIEWWDPRWIQDHILANLAAQ